MVKYTFNFTDKSVLTSLSLLFNSDLLFTVLLLFSYSIMSALCHVFCHSSLLLFCPSCCSYSVLVLRSSFTASYSSAHLLFLTVYPFFSFKTINPIRFHLFSFIHAVMTVPLPLPMGESTTSVLETETLTPSLFSVSFP